MQHLTVLDRLVAYRLPRLFVHLKEANFSTAFVAGSWVLSLFSNCFSSEPLFRVFDLLFTHAVDTSPPALSSPTTTIMFAVSLALFEAAAPSILKTPDHRGINRALRRRDFVTLDGDKMLVHIHAQYQAIAPIIELLQARVLMGSPSTALQASGAEKTQLQAQSMRNILQSNEQSALEGSFTGVTEALRTVMRRHVSSTKQKAPGSSGSAAGRAIFLQALFTAAPQLAGVEEQASAARGKTAEEKRVQSLMSMGFPRAWCAHALVVNHANVQQSSNWILQNKEALEDVDRRNNTQHPSPPQTVGGVEDGLKADDAIAEGTPDGEQVQLVLVNDALAAFELSDGNYDLRSFVFCFAALHSASSVMEKMWLCSLACHFTGSADSDATSSANQAASQQKTTNAESSSRSRSRSGSGSSTSNIMRASSSFSRSFSSSSRKSISSSMSSVSGSLMSFARTMDIAPPRIGQQQNKSPPKPDAVTVLRLEASCVVTLLVTLYDIFCESIDPVAVGLHLRSICMDLFGSFGRLNFKELVQVVHVQPLLVECLRLQCIVVKGEVGQPLDQQRLGQLENPSSPHIQRQQQLLPPQQPQPQPQLQQQPVHPLSHPQFDSDDDGEDEGAEEGFFT
jgi:hypothetical protein